MSPIRFLAVLALSCIVVAPRSAAAQSGFVEGPYVDRLASGTATLHVRTRAAVPVHVEFSTGQTTASRDSDAATMHRIVLSGFDAESRVSYTVSAPGIATASGSFVSSGGSVAKPVDFVVIGDTRDGDAEHARIIRSIAGDPSFMVHMGDFVPTGASDDEWSGFFTAAAPMLRRAAFVPTLGNHELIAPGGLERFLARFAIAGPAGATYQTFDFDGVRFIVLDSNSPLDPGTAQYRFAERELSRAESDTSLRALFVAIHHGPFSSGRHGELAPLHTSGLVDAMRRARVDLIFSGHDHMYERGEADGLKYVVTGGGGSPLYRANDHRPYQLEFASAYHHVRVQVGTPGISFDVIRSDGSLLERCAFQRGASFRCSDRTRAVRESGISPGADLVAHYGLRVLVALVAVALVIVLVRRSRNASA